MSPEPVGVDMAGFIPDARGGCNSRRCAAVAVWRMCSARRHCEPWVARLASRRMDPPLDLANLPTTQDEFEAWCDRLDGSQLGRFEFLYGCVVAEPPAGWPHGRLDVMLAHRLISHVEAAGLGLVFGSSQGFALPSGDTVAPDAAVVLRQTWEAAPSPVLGGFLTVVPDLVVEVLSPSTRRRDLRTKRDIYEGNGVREYWVVDARRRSITVITRDACDRLAAEDTVTGDEPARSALLAGFAVRPSDIFP